MKYLPLIRRIDLSTIDYIFKDLCRRYFMCDDTYEYFIKDIVRMTGNRVLQEMTLVNTLDGDDQEQSSKIRTEIEFYIKEELQEYFDGFWDLMNKNC
jgi:Ni,Fe-hydrogenase III large subunit